MSNAAAHFIYVFRSGDGAVKIGVSFNPVARFRALYTASSNDMTIEFVGECDPGAAFNIEGLAHRLLAEFHRKGEWFSASVDDAIAAIHLAAEHLKFRLNSIKPVTPTLVVRIKQPVTECSKWRIRQAGAVPSIEIDRGPILIAAPEQTRKMTVIRLLKAGELVSLTEGAKLAGVSTQAVAAWAQGFDWRAARWRKVQEVWKEAKASE